MTTLRAEIRAHALALGLLRPETIADQYPTPIRDFLRKVINR